MTREHDAPERPENTNGKPDQSPPAHETEGGGPSMSRRDMLKKGAYAAPAIMTIGSVPAFASNAPSCAKRAGDSPSNNCSENDRKSSSENKSGGNGNGNGVGHGLNHRGKGHGSTNYGTSNQGDSNYGSGSYVGNDYGDEYGSND